MTKSLAVLSTLMLITAAIPAAAADTALADWEKCAARVKKDMPVPPANQEAIDLMIKSYCGKKPAK